MMHADPRNIVIIIALIVAAILFWRNRRKVLDRNLSLLAGLVQGTIELPFLNLPFYAIVRGYYKGRRVTFTVKLGASKYSDLKICMEPMGIPESRDFLGLWHSGPTDYTMQCGSHIYYSGPGGLYIGGTPSGRPHLPRSLLRELDRQDIMFYLEHLVTAAEQMETRSSSVSVR
jgi:hypothetical protein